MDCKISRHVSEQLSSPACSAIPRGGALRVAPGHADYTARREWSSAARALSWQQSFSSLSVRWHCVEPRGHPARCPSMMGYHTIEALKPRTPNNVREAPSCLVNEIM
jgi:hypothetical protein